MTLYSLAFSYAVFQQLCFHLTNYARLIMYLKIKIVLRSINVIPETKLAPQWPSSKASQAAKAANSLPKPSQTQPTANPPKPTAYSQTSLSPVKSGPTGSSQRSFCFLSWPMGKGPWDDQQQNRQHETSKKKKTIKLFNFPQFALKSMREIDLQAEAATGEHLFVTEQSSEPQHAAPEWETSWFSTGSFLEASIWVRCIHWSKPKAGLRCRQEMF